MSRKPAKTIRVSLSWLNILIDANLDNAMRAVEWYAKAQDKHARYAVEYDDEARGYHRAARDLCWLVEPRVVSSANDPPGDAWPDYADWRDMLVAVINGEAPDVGSATYKEGHA